MLWRPLRGVRGVRGVRVRGVRGPGSIARVIGREWTVSDEGKVSTLIEVCRAVASKMLVLISWRLDKETR